MNKKAIATVRAGVACCLLAGAWFFLFPQQAEAGTSDNVSGWAWSDNIGWISFNCIDTDTCGTVDYGVNINFSNGLFSGYAWSDNIGWIRFDPPDIPPGESSSNPARINLSNNQVSGWARACAGAANPSCTGGTNPEAGGWDGWIQLRDNSIPFGVTLGPTDPDDFEGWAWGSGVIGWISFNNVTGGGAPHEVTIDPTGNPPSATNLDATLIGGTYCFVSSPPFRLEWDFDDPGDTQSAYQIQADDDSGFGSIEIDSGKVLSASEEYAPQGAQAMNYATTYYWRVKVWDSGDTESAWVAAGSPVVTDPHPWPDPRNFTWSPTNPIAGQVVQFFDDDEDVGGDSFDGDPFDPAVDPADAQWEWDFDGNGSVDSMLEDPTYTYPTVQSYDVTLTVSDELGSCSSDAQTLNTQLPFPGWKEISPF